MSRSTRPADPNVNVRNNLNKCAHKQPFNAAISRKSESPFPDRTKMVYSGVMAAILLMVVLIVIFLITHFETNRHLKEITQNIDKSRKDLLNLTRHLTFIAEEAKTMTNGRPIVQRLDHAQLTLGAKVIKLQGVELPVAGPKNEHMRNLLGMSVPKMACNILGRYLDRRNFLVFKGDKAIITIRLHQPIYPDTVRIDHYIEDLRDFKLVKAVPKDIAVYGVQMKSSDPVLLGKMRMAVNMHSKSQSAILHITNGLDAYEVYKIEILSNYGNSELTRLYKVRIYGEVAHDGKETA